jgi:hypothetical protein
MVTALALCLALAAGCTTVRTPPPGGPAPRHGPPPHAPAHGYRHKTDQGVDIVFNSSLGLYVVVGAKDHYYYDGSYYRRLGDRWEVSLRYDGSWKPISATALPTGLRAESASKPGHKDDKKRLAAADK